MLNEGSDQEAVKARIEAELAGGEPTGFAPAVDGDEIKVSFTHVMAHATAR